MSLALELEFAIVTDVPFAVTILKKEIHVNYLKFAR